MKRYIRSEINLQEYLDAHHDRKIDVAYSFGTPAEILVQLATDDDPSVRRYVALNDHTPLATLAQLAEDEQERVRCAVVNNPSTSTDILTQLAKDDSVLVRREVARNKNTPHEVIEALAKDDNEDVRTLAEERLSITKRSKRLSWPKLTRDLETEAEEGIDSLYEQTDAGSALESICLSVEAKLGIGLEASVQAGQGGIWFYSSEDDSTLASNYDYQTFNDNVISLALESRNKTEFSNKYKDFIQSILDDPYYAADDDE